MDMKKVIKEAFDKKKTSRRMFSNWNPDTSPNAYRLDVFLRKSGYRLNDIILQSYDGNKSPELIIEAIDANYMHPEITHSVSEQEFYIHVGKYGDLIPSDVRNLMKGYENALGVVDYLAELDLSTLEIE